MYVQFSSSKGQRQYPKVKGEKKGKNKRKRGEESCYELIEFQKL